MSNFGKPVNFCGKDFQNLVEVCCIRQTILKLAKNAQIEQVLAKWQLNFLQCTHQYGEGKNSLFFSTINHLKIFQI